MNEEIGRILQMVEDGKITAAEAEGLIRAVRGPAAPAASAASSESSAEKSEPAGEPLDPFRDLREIFRQIGRAQARAVRRQARTMRWRHYKYRHHEEQLRQRRADSMSVAERVRFVLRDRVMVEAQEIGPESRLVELLDVGVCSWGRQNQIARENLRFGLEEEFGIAIPADDTAVWQTVQDVVSYVSSRTGVPAEEPASAPAEPAADTPLGEPFSDEEPVETAS